MGKHFFTAKVHGSKRHIRISVDSITCFGEVAGTPDATFISLTDGEDVHVDGHPRDVESVISHFGGRIIHMETSSDD